MYTLARTQKIYGSFQSSFSNIAAQLGRVPLEILKLQAPHFSICFNSFFPPPFIYRQNALPVGVPVMKEHPVIVLSSSFSAKSIMLHFYTQQKYKNEKRATRQNRGDAYFTAFPLSIWQTYIASTVDIYTYHGRYIYPPFQVLTTYRIRINTCRLKY